MPRKKSLTPSDPSVVETVKQVVPDASMQLVAALVEAIKQTKPIEKKTASNRVPRTSWTPTDGSPKIKLKRKMYQHGMNLDSDMLTNNQVTLLNNLKPGRFLDGWVKVIRRRDKGIDIDYAIKTASQRLKLVNTFGIRNFDELLERCIEEASNPAKYAVQELD